MAVKYHINPAKGPLVCKAGSPDSCLYGSDAPHFDSKEEAEAVFQKDLSEKYGDLSSKKVGGVRRKRIVRSEFLNDFESKSTEELIAFANSSETNHKEIDRRIEDRVERTKQRVEMLDRAELRQLVDSKTLKSHKRDFEDYRNKTAELVEAHTESVFYAPTTSEWTSDRIGKAVGGDSHETRTRGWYESRYNSVGGSDVGTLASVEFEENPPGFVKGSYNRIVKSKTTPLSDADFSERSNIDSTKRTGALYRGTVWERRVRDQYSKDHPERKIYSVDGKQFSHPERDWQKVNIDGLVSDREDGVPNGILEIKTGGDRNQWKDGVPVNYRAQTLYYLNATGLEYADVRVLINDSETFEYRLNKDDEVAPGSGVNMEQYVNESVAPWFEDLKSKRSDTVPA